MGQREVIRKLKKYKLIVAEHFDIEKVALFVSYAKGKQKDESDIDVAIIVNSVNDVTYAPLLWKLSRQ